jgi:hypothetical protein
MTKLFVEDFTLITKGENNYYSEFEDEFFNEIIPNKRYKDTKFSVAKATWYISSPWIIFYQYDENNILEVVSFRTKTQCIKFLENYNASRMDEVVEGYIEYLKKLKYLNDLLNYD